MKHMSGCMLMHANLACNISRPQLIYSIIEVLICRGMLITALHHSVCRAAKNQPQWATFEWQQMADSHLLPHDRWLSLSILCATQCR
jgi:hypothetical protein